MGGQASSGSSKPQASPEQILKLYNQYLPQTLGTTVGQTPQVANTLAQSAVGANPIYTQGDLQQLGGLAPGFAQAGNQLSSINAGGQANLIAGEGGRTAINADFLNRAINPEYYKNRAALGDASSQLMGMYAKGDRLTGGEQAAAERSINQYGTQTGNLGNTSAFNTVANAMNFGQYAREKQQLMQNAIGTVGGINLQDSQFNPTNVALGAGNTANNFGLGLFNPSQSSPTINTSTDFGGNMLSGIAGLGGATKSSNSSAGGQLCCFIFLEAYNGQLPWFVRAYRDITYKSSPRIADGYKRMAKWLVPLMQKYSTARWLVNLFMVKPLTRYGGWYYQVKGYENCKKFNLIKMFWFKVWSTL